MDEEIIIDDDDLDFQFRELVHELWALSVHLDALEEQIVFWQQQDSGVCPPPLTEESSEYDEDDVLAFGEWQEHLDKVGYALPRLLRLRTKRQLTRSLDFCEDGASFGWLISEVILRIDLTSISPESWI